MPKIAFATYSDIPALTTDDLLVVDTLHSHGIEVSPAVWNDPSIEWDRYDLVVIRSCWDYHLETEAFLNWLDQMEAREIKLHNPAPVVRWNMNKRYLAEIAEKGIAVPETIWIEGGAEIDCAEIFRSTGWEEAVIKPQVSMSAYKTWISSPTTANDDTRRVRAEMAETGVMVQRFIPEIRTRGEWSFMFLAGRFSHAVLKKPAPGDFRVQNELGGTTRAIEPSQDLIRQASSMNPYSSVLYCRVDAVEAGGRLLLMELELIDPVLFFRESVYAREKFAAAISRLVNL